MKKHLQIFLLSLIVTLSVANGHAQTNVYHPFPDSNAVWGEHFSGANNAANPPCGQSDNYYLFFGGDTVIGNYTYKKVLKSGHFYNGCVSPPSSGTYYNVNQCAIRQDTVQKKVFIVSYSSPIFPFFYSNCTTDTLLYDFNLHVGDTLKPSFNNCYPSWITVVKIDSVFIGNNYRKRFLLGNLPNSSYALIEGIGSTFGLYNPFICGDACFGLDCFAQGGQTLYPNTTTICVAPDAIKEIKENPFFNISPNPSTGIFSLASAEKFSSVEILDVLGKQVYKSHASTTLSMTIDLSPHPKGIYFVKAMDEKGNFGVKKIIIH